MSEHESKDRAAALQVLVEAVARGDLVEVGQLARQAVESSLSCEQAVILRYDAERRVFATTPLLNQEGRFARREVLVPEEECSWKEAVASPGAFTISAAEVSSPAERELLGDHAVVAFVFPFYWGSELLGIVHAVATEARGLTPGEQAAAQEVAALVALALERARVNACSAAAEEAAAQWRERYARLFEHVERPVMVVDVAADLIYEANKAMAALVGYEPHELHALRLSALFRPGGMPDWRRALTNAQVPIDCTVQSKSGDPLQVTMEVARLGTPAGERCLLILRPVQAGARPDSRVAQLSELGELLSALAESGEVEDGIDCVFARIGKELGAKCGTLHVVPGQGQTLKMKAFRDCAQEGAPPFAAPAFVEGPYQRVLEAEDVVECPSVAASQEFSFLREVAARAGYGAFLAAPLRLARRAVGVLTYFFPQARSFAVDHKELLAHGARLLALLVTWAERGQRLERAASGAQTALDMVAGLWGLREVEAVVAHVGKHLHRRMDFDLLTVTLFEEGGSQARALCLASQDMAEVVRATYRWEPLADDHLGWLRPQFAEPGAPGQLALADKLGSRVSVLLLAEGLYLGNLSLGALGEDAFSQEDVQLMRMVAPVVARAIAACGAQAATHEEVERVREETVPAGQGAPRPQEEKRPSLPSELAALRRAIEELDPSLRRHLSAHGLGQERSIECWEAVRANLDRLLSAVQEQGTGRTIRPEAEAPRTVSVQKLLNEVTVELDRAGALKEVQLVVLSGPPMEIVARQSPLAQALRQVLAGVVAMVVGAGRPRVEVGYREQLLSKFLYVRYLGPAPDLSATRAGDARWRAANEQVRQAQHLVSLCGGKLLVRPLVSGEVELLVSFPKTAAIGDG
ncbi:MAG: GAF domain-containing protein [bacterium]|jgi:transcriptional regulator with GAF, ATPase, and Fis domain|nr:GAF domain-containing protein [candidate division KSB1 bacterium]MDH7561004.1 GAF domain-containing protein [bacterium]